MIELDYLANRELFPNFKSIETWFQCIRCSRIRLQPTTTNDNHYQFYYVKCFKSKEYKMQKHRTTITTTTTTVTSTPTTIKREISNNFQIMTNIWQEIKQLFYRQSCIRWILNEKKGGNFVDIILIFLNNKLVLWKNYTNTEQNKKDKENKHKESKSRNYSLNQITTNINHY